MLIGTFNVQTFLLAVAHCFREEEKKKRNVDWSQSVHFNGTFKWSEIIAMFKHSENKKTQYFMIGPNADRYSGKDPLWIQMGSLNPKLSTVQFNVLSFEANPKWSFILSSVHLIWSHGGFNDRKLTNINIQRVSSV